MADVFISYSRRDRKAAEIIASRLQKEGRSTWWDNSLSAGERWDETIRLELARARCVLVLWSRHSWASKWVHAEAQAGFGRDALVAARVDDVRIEPPFNVVQAPDLRGSQESGLKSVVEGVRQKIGDANGTTARDDHNSAWDLPPLQGQEWRVRISSQPTGLVLVREDEGTVLKERRALSQDDLAKVPRDVGTCVFVNLEPNRGGLQSCIIAGSESEVYGSMRAFWWSFARTKLVAVSAALYGAGLRGERLMRVCASAQGMWQSAIEQHPIVEMRDLMIYTRSIHLSVITGFIKGAKDYEDRVGLQIALAMVLATQSEDRSLERVAYTRFRKYLWAPGDEPAEFAEHDHLT